MRFLFALPDMAGNSPPVLEVARRLSARGHSVRALADASLQPAIETRGCTYVPFQRAPKHDSARDRNPLGAREFAWVRDHVMCGPALDYARDVADELAQHPADAAAIDIMIPGALVGAEAARVPNALLLHSVYMYPAPGLPAFGRGFLPPRTWRDRVRDALLRQVFFRMLNSGLPRLNEARAAFSLERLEHVLDISQRADRLLVMTSQAFDFEADELPANVRYTGPQLEPASQSDWQSPWPSSDSRPLVLVGLSTSQMNQEPVLRKLIRVLGDMQVRALVTTGPALDPGVFDSPANVAVRSFVPHEDVIPQSDLVITHAGHGTAIRALAAGTPMVCVPLGRDQLDIAARVVWHGAGLKASPKAKEAALKQVISSVLEDPSFRHAARTLAKAISHETAQDLAVRELEGLASG